MKMLTESLAGLTPRERLIIILGGVLGLAIMVYALAWQPWQEELTRLRDRVPEKQQTLEWMQARSAEIEMLPEPSDTGPASGEATASGLPLLTLVERSARQVGMREAITRMTPGDEDDQVRVWMDDVGFDAWLLWVDVLNDSGIGVAEASIDRVGENLVSIRATLQR